MACATKQRSHQDEPEYYIELADGHDSEVVRLTIDILLPRGFIVIERCIMEMFDIGQSSIAGTLRLFVVGI